MIDPISRIKFHLTFFCCFILLFTVGLAGIALAQTEAPEWSEPVNLSNSGGTTQPHLVVDADGNVNVLWQDEFAGLVAVQGVDGVWSDPVAIRPLFEDYLPSLKLVANPNGNLHAAWIDDESSLYTSQVDGASFTSPGAWSDSQFVALSVADFDLEITSLEELQLAYIRSTDTADF